MSSADLVARRIATFHIINGEFRTAKNMPSSVVYVDEYRASVSHRIRQSVVNAWPRGAVLKSLLQMRGWLCLSINGRGDAHPPAKRYMRCTHHFDEK